METHTLLSHGFGLRHTEHIITNTLKLSSSYNINPTSINPNSHFSNVFPRLTTKNPPRSSKRGSTISCHSVSTVPTNATQYEFRDGSNDVELRILLLGMKVESSKEIQVDADETTLAVRINRPGFMCTLMESKQLYGKIKPGETIWYLDEDQLVINLMKQDHELKWPDIVESWEALSKGILHLFKGTSIYLVGDSSEINQRVAQELAVGLGYTPLDTKELLETYTKRSVETWVAEEGSESVAAAEEAVLESLSSHVRAVVATLGDEHGAARRPDRWRYLYAGFSVWLSQSEAIDEESAIKEGCEGSEAYSKADVVVKLAGWDGGDAKSVAQASLSALKQLILSDRELPGKKSLYIRLGCRGDWPNIMPPGWNPSSPPTTN